MLALAGCSTLPSTDPSPDGNAAEAASPSPLPGEAEYMPPADEACPFLVGDDGADYTAYSGFDISDLTIVEDVRSVFPPGGDHFLSPLVDHDALICLLEPPTVGEFVAFAWVPIDETERDAVIAELMADGRERSESEGGMELTFPDDPTNEMHLVTNAGWYYSTDRSGAIYLRTVFED
jgi:hypothetical protein